MNNKVSVVGVIKANVDMINARKFPIQDEYIEKYRVEKKLDLVITMDARAAYKDAEFVAFVVRTTMTVRRTTLIHPLWKL